MELAKFIKIEVLASNMLNRQVQGALVNALEDCGNLESLIVQVERDHALHWLGVVVPHDQFHYTMVKFLLRQTLLLSGLCTVFPVLALNFNCRIEVVRFLARGCCA